MSDVQQKQREGIEKRAYRLFEDVDAGITDAVVGENGKVPCIDGFYAGIRDGVSIWRPSGEPDEKSKVA
jgi:hypothetical protein